MEFEILGIFSVTISNFALAMALLFFLTCKIIKAFCKSEQESQQQEVEYMRFLMRKY